jgi:hypothetical protein
MEDDREHHDDHQPAGGEDREPGKDTRRRQKEDSDRAEDLCDADEAQNAGLDVTRPTQSLERAFEADRSEEPCWPNASAVSRCTTQSATLTIPWPGAEGRQRPRTRRPASRGLR